MKPFRRIFDYIKGFVSCDECKPEDIREVRKQLMKLKEKTARRKRNDKKIKRVV